MTATVHVDDFSPGGVARDVPIDLSAPTKALLYFRSIPEVAAELARRGSKTTGAGTKTAEPTTGPKAAGLLLHARDTGRVLMLQRALSDDDPAAGTWEAPGGCIDDGENPEQAARREWSEETGTKVPKGSVSSVWTSSDGVYVGHVMKVDSEADVPINLTEGRAMNPDDPDGDNAETVAWWDPEHLVGHPALRSELAADLPRVHAALREVKDFKPSEPRDDHGRWTGPLYHGTMDSSLKVGDVLLPGKVTGRSPSTRVWLTSSMDHAQKWAHGGTPYPQEGDRARVFEVEPVDMTESRREPGFFSASSARIVAEHPAGQKVDYERDRRLYEASQHKDFKPSEMRDRRGRWSRSGSSTTKGVEDALGKISVRGKPNGTGTVDDPVDVGNDLDRAVELLGEGRHIRLTSPIQVGTLLDKLAAVVHDAEKRKSKAPTYDLCKVSVPGTNLFCAQSQGVPRAQMPQLKGYAVEDTAAWTRAGGKGDVKVSFEDDFRQALADIGLPTHRVTLPASHLKASQSELSGIGVAEMVQGIKAGKVPERPIFVTRDGYVIDGHHRWAAKVAIDSEDGQLGDVPMDTEMIDLDIGAALDFARAFVAAVGIHGKKMGQTAPPVSTKAIDFDAYEAMANRLDMLAERPALETKDHDVSHELREPHSGRWTRGGAMLADALKPLVTRQVQERTGLKDPVKANADLLEDPTSMENLPDEVKARLVERVKDVFGVTPEEMHAHLTATLEKGLADPRNDGAGWYADAGQQARQIAHDTGYTDEQTIGATAAMSPQTEWGANIALTAFVSRAAKEDWPVDADAMHKLSTSMLTKKVGGQTNAHKVTKSQLDWAREEIESNARRGFTAETWPDTLEGTKLSDHGPYVAAALIKAMGQVGLHTEDGKALSFYDDVERKKSRVSFSSGLGGVSRALRILRGEQPAAVLGGHKVRSFYNNILLGESNPFPDVTIDTHAISAAVGKKVPASSPLIVKGFNGPSFVGLGLSGTYPVFADAYRRVAAEHGLKAHQAQAIIWLQWREEHK